jgi:sulfatase maturation enzyme AslB (radical SAM superfamily)
VSRKLVPETVQIELTSRCNSACPYCRRTQAQGLSIGDMGFDLYKYIIRKSPDGCLIKFSGAGEPTLYNRLPEAIEYAAKNGHKTWLITNGSAPYGKVIGSIKRYCYKVSISVDDCESDGYEAIRRGLSFDALLQNVVVTRSLKMRFSVIVVLTNDNIARRDSIVSYWKSVAGENRVRTAREIEQAQPVGEIYVDGKPPICRHDWCRKSTMIRFNGDMILCCKDVGNYVIGNIAGRSVVSLYNSDRFASIRDSMRTGVGFPEICSRCSIEMDTQRYAVASNSEDVPTHEPV